MKLSLMLCASWVSVCVSMMLATAGVFKLGILVLVSSGGRIVEY